LLPSWFGLCPLQAESQRYGRFCAGGTGMIRAPTLTSARTRSSPLAMPPRREQAEHLGADGIEPARSAQH